MKIALFLILITAGVSLSCKSDAVNISRIKVSITVDRFEKDLFSADPSTIRDSVPVWQIRYGSFLQYFSYVVQLGNVNDPAFADRLTSFAADYTNYLIYKRTIEVFPDMDTLTGELEKAFKHFRFYFPEKQIPRIITYISGFNRSAITGDSLIAIGLDKYLGTREQLYADAGIYKYLVANMYPEKITSDCISFWGETEFPYYDSINNLVSNMVYRGRLMYFTRLMLPDRADTVNWGFSARDLEYCHTYEKVMWTGLIEKKYLFDTDRFTIDKFILEGPYTREFGRESPARAAVWIGYKIVASYMDRHPEISLSQLMEEKNYLKILNQSSYNP